MVKYVILLRGINVGGKNKVSMKELKELLENNGFSDVSTYINSGNVIFSCESLDVEFLKKTSEALILDKLKLKLNVLVISATALLEAAGNVPVWWGVDAASKHNAIFVIPPVTVEEVFAKVGEIKPEYEQVGHHGSVIFWSAPIATFSVTRWAKVVGSSAYDSVTIRNANTFWKLVELAKGEKEA